MVPEEKKKKKKKALEHDLPLRFCQSEEYGCGKRCYFTSAVSGKGGREV